MLDGLLTKGRELHAQTSCVIRWRSIHILGMLVYIIALPKSSLVTCQGLGAGSTAVDR